MKSTNIKKWVVLAACVSLIPITSKAVPDLDLSNALGRVIAGVPANASTDEKQVNAIVDRANGLTTSPYDVAGNTYTVLNDPALALPYAVFVTGGGVGGRQHRRSGIGRL